VNGAGGMASTGPRRALHAAQAALSVPHRLYGVALLRVGLSAVVLAIYVMHFAQRAFLWGSDGAYPTSLFLSVLRAQRSFSLYAFSDAPTYQLLVYVAGMLVSFLLMVGWKSRLNAVLFYVFTWSLYARNPLLLDGGDNLLYILAFFLMFTRCGEYLSIDRLLHADRPARDRPFLSLIHNYALAAMIVQLCLLYFTSAFYKMQGHMWQNGTALYYVLNVNEFNLTALGHSLSSNAYLIAFLTYSAMLFQAAYPFLIWHHRIKWLVVAGAVAFHLGIAYCMGLAWFSLVLITAEFLILSDREYLAFRRWVTSLRRPALGLPGADVQEQACD